MQATLIPVFLKNPGGRPRGEGIHVSSIIRCAAVEMGVLDSKWVEDLSLVDTAQEDWWESLDEPTKIRMSLGLAWEEWYVRTQLEDVLWQPGEMCVEGIYMNHDGEGLDVIITTTHDNVWMPTLHEIKTTAKSTKTVGDLTTQWMWLAQTKAYCKALNTTRAYLHVLFLRGDWKWPYNMEMKCWQIDYTPEEIEDNWEVLMDYVKQRQIQEADAGGSEWR